MRCTRCRGWRSRAGRPSSEQPSLRWFAQLRSPTPRGLCRREQEPVETPVRRMVPARPTLVQMHLREVDLECTLLHHAASPVSALGSVHSTPCSAPNASIRSCSSHISPTFIRDVRPPSITKPPSIPCATRCPRVSDAVKMYFQSSGGRCCILPSTGGLEGH